MSDSELESLERYLQELEALKDYARVKGERDSLSAEIGQLGQKVAQLEAQLRGETATTKELAAQLSRSQAEVKGLARQLDDASGELSSLKDFKGKLPGGGGVSLAEMRVQFLKAEEAEIEGRAQARLRELERELRSQMPTLVRERLTEILKSSHRPPDIEKVLNSRARQMADEILRDRKKWPGWFKELYLKDVKQAVDKGLDSEFDRRVKAEAQKRVETMKAGQWRTYVAEKAKEIATDLRGLVRQLQGAWWFTCDRCRHRLALDIGPPEIGALLSGKTLDVACTACVDPALFPFLLSTVPHQVSSVSLAGLLQAYMGKAPSTE